VKTTSPPLSIFAYSLCAGLCLTCFALLLHPMSPDDFLTLCLTKPQATWESAYGIQATALFWISLVPALAGIAGMLHCAFHAARKAICALRHHSAGTVTAMREGWSF